MLFNSINFLIFFPIVVVIYYVIPTKFKTCWLLCASYFFYMCWNPKYALLMLTSTGITYISGILMDKCLSIEVEEKQRKYKKICVFICIFLNLSILFFFKYFDFFIENVNAVLSYFHFELLSPSFDIMLPVGISFYTFQALGYTIDVYRKEIYAEKSFLKYALFVSFFPQLVAGPIERSKNLLVQLSKTNKFDYKNIKEGLLRMSWGFFMKLVIADRAAILVNQVYNNYLEYSGSALFIATCFFSIQIYCDFYSYSEIARGAAQVMGFRLIKNFDAPYFSRSIAEFWRRWHISLSSWFRDYLYFPLGGSRVSTMKRYRNILIVFIVSGLWHGAQWSFIVWGGLHGIYQVIGYMTAEMRNKCKEYFHVKTNAFSYKLWQMFFTFSLVNFTWIFFRAPRFQSAYVIIKKILWDFDFKLFVNENIYELGLERADFWLLIVAIIILIFIDLYKNRISVFEKLEGQGIIFRWALYLVIVFGILIFGIYGSGYDASQFIYFQF